MRAVASSFSFEISGRKLGLRSQPGWVACTEQDHRQTQAYLPGTTQASVRLEQNLITNFIFFLFIISQERWLLLPQVAHPAVDSVASLSSPTARGRNDHIENDSVNNDAAGTDIDAEGDGEAEAGGMLADRGLLVRLATKEDILEEGPGAASMKSLLEGSSSGFSVERAAASARYLLLFFVCVRAL